MGKIETIIPIILFNVLFILFIVGIILFIRQYKIKKKEHHTMLQLQHEEHQRELLSTQIEIQNQTMQQIGREIHDNVGQKLTLASLYTQQLAIENKNSIAIDSIENISDIINQSLSELRSLSKSLTDNVIEENSIEKLIEKECEKVINLKTCKVHFNKQTSIKFISYNIKSIILRITQEFIQNSIKHSKCKNINVDLSSNDEEIQLTLIDDGKGFDTSKKYDGIGLSNMKKRVEIFNGTIIIQSAKNQGTTVKVILPLL